MGQGGGGSLRKKHLIRPKRGWVLSAAGEGRECWSGYMKTAMRRVQLSTFSELLSSGGVAVSDPTCCPK